MAGVGRYILGMLKAVLVIALGFGGGLGLLIFIFIIVFHNERSAFLDAAGWGLSIGLVAGILLGFVFLLLDLSARLYQAKGMHKQIWELEQFREMEVEGSSKEVLAASREALLAIPYIESVSDDAENLVTRATSGTSWRSSGEHIEVEINPVSEGKWLVRCSSKTKSSKIVFDYGKNFENVESWFSKMKQSGTKRKA
ncbi:MAG: hypothetical protein K8F91_18965 [Candidatus Obscuribacterales bacterium]|nr:hypothetical protein [Candidatus Obscuribacterales bacterium]